MLQVERSWTAVGLIDFNTPTQIQVRQLEVKP